MGGHYTIPNEAKVIPMTRSRLQLLGLVLLITILASHPKCNALTEDGVNNDLAKAYEAVALAESAGGDVHNLITTLNEAARMIPGASQTQLENAKSLIDSVQTHAPQVQTQGAQRITNRLIFTGASITVIAFLAAILWIRGSKWFWEAWLRVHRGWRIERV